MSNIRASKKSVNKSSLDNDESSLSRFGDLRKATFSKDPVKYQPFMNYDRNSIKTTNTKEADQITYHGRGDQSLFLRSKNAGSDGGPSSNENDIEVEEVSSNNEPRFAVH